MSIDHPLNIAEHVFPALHALAQDGTIKVGEHHVLTLMFRVKGDGTVDVANVAVAPLLPSAAREVCPFADPRYRHPLDQPCPVCGMLGDVNAEDKCIG